MSTKPSTVSGRPSGLYAVVMGDIIKSGRLSPEQLESVRSSLLAAIDQVTGWEPGLVKGQAEFFRGDAWQVLLTRPGHALRVAVFLRATLLAQGIADTRISIGIGSVEHVSSGRVSLSSGKAFALSGHGLDGMIRNVSMTIELSDEAGASGEWLQVIGHLCGAVIGGWTKRQAEIALLAVEPGEPTHEEIANMLHPPVSKQAVTKSLHGAHWYVVREAVRKTECSLF